MNWKEYGQSVAESMWGKPSPPVFRTKRKRRLLPGNEILEALDSKFIQVQAMNLIGVSSEKQKALGECLSDHRACIFDYWVPHRGIAIDVAPRDDEEVSAKRAWCETNAVIYVAPEDMSQENRFETIELIRQASKDRSRGVACVA